MAHPLNEIRLLLNVLMIILSFEISFYAIYKHNQIHYQKLPLDWLLIFVGCLFLLNILSVFSLIGSLIFLTPFDGMFISSFIVQFSFIPLLILTINGTISNYVNNKANWGFLAGEIILIILAICFRVLLPENKLSISTFLLVSFWLFILYFLSLILAIFQKITGKLRIKLLFITSGIILVFVSFQFSYGLFSFTLSEILHNFLAYFGNSVGIIGFIMILIGIYNFPTFYEFNWKQNLLYLFILNQKRNSILYNYAFSNATRQSNEEINQNGIPRDFRHPISGITGVDNILSEISNTQEKNLQEISKGDVLILLEYGTGKFSHITYALIAKKQLESHRGFLKTVQNQFQSFYRNLLLEEFEKGEEEQLFKSFDMIIKDLYTY